MPNHHSAEERVRRSERDNTKNRNYKKELKNKIKEIEKLTTKSEAQLQLKGFHSMVDKMITKGIIHRNKGANLKSTVALKIKSLS
jgi:small subunit ribosomal protein S20